MDLANVSDAIWQLEDGSATISTATFAAALDLAHPTSGLRNLAMNGRRLESTKILQLRSKKANTPATDDTTIDETASREAAPWEIADCYCRGRDLVVTYAASKEQPLRTQLIWRLRPAGESPTSLGGIELIVSVQTDSLGTDPEICVESSIASEQTLKLVESANMRFAPIDGDAPIAKDVASNGYLIRVPDSSASIAYFVHPDDYHGANPSFDQTPQGVIFRVVQSLFADNLEKGVLLRGRMAAIFFADSEAAESASKGAASNGGVLAAYRQFSTQPLPLTT